MRPISGCRLVAVPLSVRYLLRPANINQLARKHNNFETTLNANINRFKTTLFENETTLFANSPQT